MRHKFLNIILEISNDFRIGVELLNILGQRMIAAADIVTSPAQEVEFSAMVVVLFRSAHALYPIPHVWGDDNYGHT
jgi:hypothetical protein